MGGQVSIEGDVHVVVVGGGFAGIAAGQQLKSMGIPFTLIDVRDAFHHNIAALRASVQSGFALQTFIPYSETFGSSFRQGLVKEVNTDTRVVILDGEQEIPYTHLILCTGTEGTFPGSATAEPSYRTAIQKYEDLVKEIQAAGSVLVVGGGCTGVEMAAEVKTEYPDKKVVLIHSQMDLGDPKLIPSVRQQAKDVLLEKGVELVLGEKVVNLSDLQLNKTQKDMKIQTDKGTVLACDIVICCMGSKINSKAYRSTLGEFMTENGSLKVNEHLQLAGLSNLYVIGDCADINESKMAYHAGLHAHVAVNNIFNSLTGKPLTTYQPGSMTMLLAMGYNDGVGQIYGFWLPRFLVALVKSRSLLLWKSWREMGQKAPTA
ncbi:apoptosis-inducing factor 2 [Brienomyrus brachyistius]|uniref:apoptosis-inducing factor 2 n=1 Tax=Brienomyrus brachyistius TaxID=42636 RepID=UPI0020B37B61|nr:apoptosis-inducing factor 2 [Brienomyrus brachyistius]XP_048863910.1 apoptosis-inducing factor 2 [Brienomyrus brachyistius]XP_048863911.1 apoptosis-inducing factor 2 [Brienomyrus brachyistius]XP_048863912.1 apoptosis-inducing factor 2 [Brienomyrus brachyistius]